MLQYRSICSNGTVTHKSRSHVAWINATAVSEATVHMIVVRCGCYLLLLTSSSTPSCLQLRIILIYSSSPTPSFLYLCAIIPGQRATSQPGRTNRRHPSEGSHPVLIETRPTGAVGTLLDQELRLVHTETLISPSRQRR